MVVRVGRKNKVAAATTSHGDNSGYNVGFSDDLYFVHVFAGVGITGGSSSSGEMAEQKSTMRVAVSPEIATAMPQGEFIPISRCHDVKWRSPSSMGWHSGGSVVGEARGWRSTIEGRKGGDCSNI
ncbi:unnamed protein product [Lactuca virosa]|uniref:Uncharacterized protein n=1 Tax=Lactuca virosa TaxID=75947 RepID=A0AAU9NTP5_9ASTR|nr:unnamed protein product [Lactuca virosa]